MKNAILIHGRPDKDEYYNPDIPAYSNWHWIPWLQKQLQVKDIFAQTPEIPMSFRPNYETWKKEFERYDIGPATILVGHSCGGGFLVRWLSENKTVKVGRVVLVAPWINPDNDPASETGDFFKFEIDKNLPDRTAGVTIFSSDDDYDSVLESVAIIRKEVANLKYREFPGYKHFWSTMRTDAFQQLLEECLLTK